MMNNDVHVRVAKWTFRVNDSKGTEAVSDTRSANGRFRFRYTDILDEKLICRMEEASEGVLNKRISIVASRNLFRHLSLQFTTSGRVSVHQLGT